MLGPTPDTTAKPVTPIGSLGVGVVVPYDFALDRELWRWVPEPVNLLLTRTPHHRLPVSVSQAESISDPAVLTGCALSIIETSPDVVAYACTSGSFVHGHAGELALRVALRAAGVPHAVTASGALADAVAALGVRKLAVATPYDAMVTARLRHFLAEHGIEVVTTSYLGLTERIWALDYDEVAALVRRSVTPECDAVFLSCTNVPSYDVIAPLERELGIPVLTANQVTLWAALRVLGLGLVGPGQALAEQAAPRPADELQQEAR